MADQTFEEFVAGERERLTQERERLFDQQHEIERRLADINAEMHAINAYQAVREGRPVPAAAAAAPPAKAPAARRAEQAPKRSRVGSGGVRQQVLDLVRKAGGPGITGSDIAAALHMDDKGGRQAIANALMALKKDGAVHQSGRRQPYTATEHPEQDQAEAA